MEDGGEIREGNRGGRALFKWDDVKADKHKAHYLGNSVHANVGRWQMGKDLFWYRRTDKEVAEDIKKAEIEEVRRKELELMNSALGIPIVESTEEPEELKNDSNSDGEKRMRRKEKRERRSRKKDREKRRKSRSRSRSPKTRSSNRSRSRSPRRRRSLERHYHDRYRNY